jgi:hypothetical protein
MFQRYAIYRLLAPICSGESDPGGIFRAKKREEAYASSP